MTNPEYVEPDDRAGRTWKDVLVEDRWKIIGVLLAAGAVAVYYGYEVEVPRTVRLYGVYAGATALLGYAPAARLVAWLYSPNYTFLPVLDGRDGEFEVWQLPSTCWRELTVTDGELFKVRALAPCWFAQTFDPEDLEATGTWRGSASDLELIKQQEKIDEVRGILEDLAKEGLSYRVKQSGIIRNAVRGIVLSFVEGFEKNTLYDGEQVRKSVDKALAGWSLDEGEEDADDDLGDDGSETEVNQSDAALEAAKAEAPADD